MTDQIATYYDSHVARKLRDFVEGNPRIDAAFETLRKWVPAVPERILEIGCGIGHVCHRMSTLWPAASIVGIDLSPRSIEIADRLFAESGITFSCTAVASCTESPEFDLIVLMDVYEHIPTVERDGLHRFIASAALERQDARVFLSFPTPRHQSWLRIYHPAEIQPVDEDIDFNVICEMAKAIKMDVLYYGEVDVWHQGDYAHAVLGMRGQFGIDGVSNEPEETSAPRSVWQSVKTDLCALITRHSDGVKAEELGDRDSRLEYVRRRLGSEAYD